ncbi:MAG TPA: RbsD/FucU domain-containing protein [Acidobacteriaceae bacterium]
MLKTLSVLHTPELLHALASMGHGDELALVDANFPSASNAQRLVRLDGSDLPSALEAILQLVPLDTFVDHPAHRMMQVHAPDEIPEVQKQCQAVIDKAEGKPMPLAGIRREEFYERARKAFVVIHSGERRTYGCLLIKKGVVYLPSEAR